MWIHIFMAMGCNALQNLESSVLQDDMTQGLTKSSSVERVSLPDMSDAQHSNSLKEDQIAVIIWDKWVDGGGRSSCTSLRKMVNAYAYQETSAWDMNNDVNNPEWPKMFCPGTAKVRFWHPEECAYKGRADQGGEGSATCCTDSVPSVPVTPEIIKSYNELLKLNRRKLGDIASRAACPQVLDLLGSPVPLVRNAAIWELVFRRPDHEWSSAADRDNMLHINVVAAYNSVRCRLGNDWNMPCDKKTETAAQGLSPMFRFKKGRSGTLYGQIMGADGELHGGVGAPGGGQRLLTLNGGVAYLNRDLRVLDQGNDHQGSIVNFWGKHDAGQNGGGQPLDLAECDPDLRENFCRTAAPAECTWWQDYCRFMTELSNEQNEVTKEIWSPTPIVVPEGATEPDLSGEAVDKGGVITYHFKRCGVPWVGGVSGSVLEFFGMIEKHMTSAIDDLLILQWMAYYELRAFHSMGEVWTALHPFLTALGYSADGTGTNNVKLGLLKVLPPMTTDGCNSGREESESEFLDGLQKFVEGLVVAPVLFLPSKAEGLASRAANAKKEEAYWKAMLGGPKVES